MPQFWLFVLAVAALFLRPGELVPGWEQQPIYEALILAAIAAAARPMLGQLSAPAVAARPVTGFVLGVLAAVPLSHLAHGLPSAAFESGFMFAKVALLYLLIVANLRTVPRFRRFLLCLGALMVAQVGVGLLGYFGYLDLEAVRAFDQRETDPETGELRVLPRLCGAGIFNDPNDLCVLLGVGVVLALYLLGDRRAGALRWAAVVPLGVFAAAIPLTQSRGGLLAVLAGLATLAVDRLGPRRGALLLALLAPVFLVAAGGRMTRFEVGDADDTSQHRIRLWSEGFVLMQSNPVFGIGVGQFQDEVGLVAHNSFVHAYTELGFFGGTCFFAAFAYTVWALWRLRGRLRPTAHPTLHRLRPYLLAMVVALVVGLMSLSRVYTPPTYLILALCTAYFQVVAAAAPGAVPRLTGPLAVRLTVLSGAFLLALRALTLLLIQRS